MYKYKARQFHLLSHKPYHKVRASFDREYYKKTYPNKPIPTDEEHSLQMQLEKRNTGTFKRGGKNYLPGFVYQDDIETSFHVLHPNLDDMTTLKIKCLHPNGRHTKSTTIRFKNLALTTHFSKTLKENARYMLKHGGGVSRKLPSGHMAVAGANDKKPQGYQYKATRKEQRKLLHHMRRLLTNNGFQRVVSAIKKKTNLQSIPDVWGPKSKRRLQDTKSLWSAFLVVSKNLGNESHTDIDISKSVAIWHEDDPAHVSDNWYFLLPQVQIKDKNRKYMKKPVAIKLSHGTIVEWDGRLIKHCTSITKPKKKGAAYSTFVCANERANARYDTMHYNTFLDRNKNI